MNEFACSAMLCHSLIQGGRGRWMENAPLCFIGAALAFIVAWCGLSAPDVAHAETAPSFQQHSAGALIASGSDEAGVSVSKERTLSYEIRKRGADGLSHVNGILDANVRYVEYDDGSKAIDVLVPDGAEAQGGATGDMIVDIAIEQGDSFVSASRAETGSGVEYRGLPVDAAQGTYAIAFGLKGSDHTDSTLADYGTYQTADLVLSPDCAPSLDWWAGYAAEAPTGLADGIYRMNIATKLGSSAEWEAGSASYPYTVLNKPTMGDNVFGEYVWIEVSGGAYTAYLDTEAVRAVYMDDFQYYSRTGDYLLNDNGSSYLKSCRKVTLQRNDDASLFMDGHGTYADVIKFPLPAKGAQPYAYLRMKVFSSSMPFPGLVNDAAWVALFDWSTLQKVDALNTASLDAQVLAADKLVQGDYVSGWAGFQNALGFARDALAVAFMHDQSYIDDACARLKAAKSALVLKKKTQKLTGKSPVSKKLGDKAFSLGVASDARGATLAYKTSNSKVATVSKAGKVTLKGLGSAAITVTATASGYEKAVKTVTVKVVLGKAALTKKTASAKKGKVTAAWSKVAGATGYQVKVGSKTYSVNSAKTLSKTVAAKAGSKVKVLVRACAKVSGKKVYGAWSAAKTVTVKRK